MKTPSAPIICTQPTLRFTSMDSQFAPLSESCAKLLSDKTYDKRKAAALEIEK